jgi:flavin reductase (DIM6/NTAB) family NADH-FMN oxidoreductase RutF
MQIDTTQLSSSDNYKLLVHCVVPRPIAWVSTLSSDGKRNIAPFSYFAAVTSAPPTLMVSIGKRKGVPKDTARNLLHTKQCVVQICHRPLAQAMVQTSAELQPDIDEFELIGLHATDAEKVKAPRVADAAIALECRVSQHLEVGDKRADVFFLEVVFAHLRDDVLGTDYPDPARLRAVGRLGGNGYCDTAEPFFIERPG